MSRDKVLAKNNKGLVAELKQSVQFAAIGRAPKRAAAKLGLVGTKL